MKQALESLWFINKCPTRDICSDTGSWEPLVYNEHSTRDIHVCSDTGSWEHLVYNKYPTRDICSDTGSWEPLVYNEYPTRDICSDTGSWELLVTDPYTAFSITHGFCLSLCFPSNWSCFDYLNVCAVIGIAQNLSWSGSLSQLRCVTFGQFVCCVDLYIRVVMFTTTST